MTRESVVEIKASDTSDSKTIGIERKLFVFSFVLVVLLMPGFISVLWFTIPKGEGKKAHHEKGAEPVSAFGLEATGFSLFGLPMILFSVFLEISWVMIWLVYYFLSAIVLFMISSFPRPSVKKTAATLESLKFMLTLVLWSISNIALSMILSIYCTGITSYFWLPYLWSIVAIVMAVFLEKLFIGRFSTRFHHSAYSKRIHEFNYFKQDIESILAGIKSDRASPRDKLTGAMEELEVMSCTQRLGEPISLAEQLFKGIRQSGDRLVANDFTPFFPSRQKAEQVFLKFDCNTNGSITLPDVESVIKNFYADELRLKESIYQTDVIVGKLDKLLCIAISVILFFLCCSICSIDISTFTTSLLAIWAGLLFAVGGTFKTLVECIIFLFDAHNFDQGDKISLDGETLKVQEIRLLSTIFVKSDGGVVTWPNIELSKKPIQNLRRSGAMGEWLKFGVGIDTTQCQLDRLQEFLETFIRLNFCRGLVPSVKIGTGGIYDAKRLDLMVKLSHKSNFEDGGARLTRRTAFTLAVVEGMMAVGIKLVSKPFFAAEEH